MHYGNYPIEFLPIIKSACLEAYADGKFRGGRGIVKHKFDGLTYFNFPKGNIAKFTGEEKFMEGTQVIGEYTYSGGTLYRYTGRA